MASAMAALLIISCGKKEEEAVSVSSVTVSPDSVEITESESTKLSAKISPAAAADRTVVWSSSDKTIATVDGNGQTGQCDQQKGDMEVRQDRHRLRGRERQGHGTEGWRGHNHRHNRGRRQDRQMQGDREEHGLPVTGVEVHPWAVTLFVRGTSGLSYMIKPADATNQRVKWESDTPSVATVDSQGNVKGIAAGTSITIRKTSTYGHILYEKRILSVRKQHA